MLTQTKAERIVELLGIINNKNERIKKLKLECGRQATKICTLHLQIEELERGQLDFAKETGRILKNKIQRIEELEAEVKPHS